MGSNPNFLKSKPVNYEQQPATLAFYSLSISDREFFFSSNDLEYEWYGKGRK